MKNHNKKLLLIILIFCGLPSLAQEEQKMESIGLQYKFPENMDSVLMKKLHPEIYAMKQQFNKESTHFKLSMTDEQVAHIFVLDLSKVKVISKKGRNKAYWINGIGMTIIPVAAFAVGASMPIMLNYFPQNVVKSSLTTPESFSGKQTRIKVNLCTGVMFTNDDKMRTKLAQRITKKLFKKMKKLDNKMASNANTSTYLRSN